MKSSVRNLSAFAVAMLITGSVDSVRNLPATALFGSQLFFFAIFSALVFLIPTGLLAAQLASNAQLPTGIYGWVRTAFGKRIGLLAVWLQWINTLIWYPTILSFIAGTIAYLISPVLAQNKYYLITIILSTFWIMTLINLRGLKASTRFASTCAVVGMVVPMGLIIFLGLTWLAFNRPLQISFQWQDLWPSFTHGNSWISLTAIMTAFLGMELAAVHVKDVHNPQKTFPRALFFSVIFILFTMIAGALSIAIVLPAHQIQLVSGVMQAFQYFFAAYHLEILTVPLVIMLVLGSVGSLVNWIISPTKGLLHAGEEGFLPPWLCTKNKHNVPSVLLIGQAILVTLICVAFLIMPSVNGSYWFLTALSTQLYMLMYVLMFLAAIQLEKDPRIVHSTFRIPGKRIGTTIAASAGLVGSLTTVVVGFFPPDGIDVGPVWQYELSFAIGMCLMAIPALGFWWYQRKRGTHLTAITTQDSETVALY
ncbi:MAG: transporter [Gammaproteobacteria bacterium RIFCSPHIGHO2_12_FULL_45_9]|nr:MAG: transporter [Gammaproteobacteria bacterium RIFCSPHIGHO2_12_FULL_45_9]